MTYAETIEKAVRQTTDETSFLRDVLAGALGWPIDMDATRIEDISYDWSADDLRITGLDSRIIDGTIRQIQPLPPNPWGIFVINFARAEVFVGNHGLTSTLRAILRGLVPSKRKSSALASFDRDHILFICTHAFKHYKFAYFQAGASSPTYPTLTTFGWGPGEPIRTLCEFNLSALVWPAMALEPQPWVDAWARAFDIEKVTQR
jgi:hypothetical protein